MLPFFVSHAEQRHNTFQNPKKRNSSNKNYGSMQWRYGFKIGYQLFHALKIGIFSNSNTDRISNHRIVVTLLQSKKSIFFTLYLMPLFVYCRSPLQYYLFLHFLNNIKSRRAYGDVFQSKFTNLLELFTIRVRKLLASLGPYVINRTIIIRP